MVIDNLRFRAKTDNGQFIYGFICPGGKISKKWYIVTQTNTYEIDIRTLGQYTGLKDKNGREIYEGDIVRVYGNPQLHEDFEYQATVEWIDYAKFQYKLKSGVSGDMGIHIVEIIGNIHDNPELLK